MKLKNDLLIPDWNKNFSNLICGFSLPKYGNQVLTRKSRTSKKTNQENHVEFCTSLGLKPNVIFYPYQIHSDIIIHVKKII